MNILTFDIETVPDVESGRRIYDLENVTDEDVAKAMSTKQAQKTGGSEFLPLHLQKVVAISAVLRTRDTLKIWSLGTETSSEKDLITRFYDGIEKFTPTLVSWNGGGFDLPVLHYRSLLNNVVASRYWDNGEADRDFKFNNYLSRYHWRHVDVMDVLALFNLRAAAPLDQIAVMLGFPGKLGMSGADVWDAYLAGKLQTIRDYCETDVLNTYLIYLRFEKLRGTLVNAQYEAECARLKALLKDEDKSHFQTFLAAWEKNDQAVSV